MGRQTSSNTQAPASFRRAARAKRAKQTVNKDIPALLKASPRAKRGVESSELIVDPGPVALGRGNATKPSTGKGSATKRDGDANDETDVSHGRRRKGRKKVAADSLDAPAPTVATNTTDNERSCEQTRRSEGSSASRIRICVADTLQAARDMLRELALPQSPFPPDQAPPQQRSRKDNTGPRIAVLNMASPLRPGGGFLSGATSQEESLCMRTTLYPALQESFYRLPEIGGVYTRDILVFREADATQNGELVELRKDERWFVDVITAAMLRFPDVDADSGGDGAAAATADRSRREDYDDEDDDEDTDADGGAVQPNRPALEYRYANDSDRTLVEAKMRAVLRMAELNRVDGLVLGAWGCGAYGNPVGEVARAWRKVLTERDEGGHGKGKRDNLNGNVLHAMKSGGISNSNGGEDDDEDEDEHDSNTNRGGINKTITGIPQGPSGPTTNSPFALPFPITFAITSPLLAQQFARHFDPSQPPTVEPPRLPRPDCNDTLSNDNPGAETTSPTELAEKIAQLRLQATQSNNAVQRVMLQGLVDRLIEEQQSEG